MDPYYILAAFGFLILLVAALQTALLLRRPPDASAVIPPLQTLTQSVGALNAGLQTIAERVRMLERDQTQIGQAVSSLGNAYAENGAVTRGLSDTAAAIRAEVQGAQRSIAALQAQTNARQELDLRTADSVRRLEAIIAGTQSKGAAGENMVEFVFAQLPAEWQARNFTVGNRSVEFGLRLPNGLVLPIDSKWAATPLLEEFLAAKEPAAQTRLKAELEKAVLAKAREVAKYIDPDITVNFGVAAVPDAVFDLCPRAQVEAMQWNVVLLSYSMFIPYLLLAFQTILRTGQEVDVQKLSAHLENARKLLGALSEELEGRLSRAITMLANSRDDMRTQLSRLQTGFLALRTETTGDSAVLEPPGES